MHELLTPDQMSRADALTIERGIAGIELMQNAGDVVFTALHEHFPNAHRILIVAGIGNNGGDGFVLANTLLRENYNVTVAILGDEEKITGDARLAYDDMSKGIPITAHPNFNDFDLIVDAIFGTGLKRKIEGNYVQAFDAINTSPAHVLSIDLPSGVDGQTGEVLPCAIKADVTATFFRYKPGHFLYPGRKLCGEIVSGQIGIPDQILSEISPTLFLNTPKLWFNQYPIIDETGHKYGRGHTLAISGGLDKSGAARLMAKAALRMGSGLVTIACPMETMPIHATCADAIMITKMDTDRELEDVLTDKRINTVCVGPGLNPNAQTRNLVKILLQSNRSIVLDAGALTAFSEQPEELFDVIKARTSSTILTPHDGEFVRLFPLLKLNGDKVSKAKSAAEKCGATIVLKGADTVIANGLNLAAISNNAPPWLATAGSGDVLCGLIAGLLAQGMSEFEAACAGVWFHGEAGTEAGPGMISSDLEYGVRSVIKNLHLNGFD